MVPGEVRHRRLRGIDGQPRGLILEVARELRAVARPRNHADHHTVTTARDARSGGLHERHRRPEIQRAPTPPALAEIEPRRPSPAEPAAITLPPVRPDGNDHLPLGGDLHVLDDRPLQAQQPAPYPCTAHAANSSSRFQPSTSRNPRRHAACAPYSPFTSPTARAGAPEKLLTPPRREGAAAGPFRTSSTPGERFSLSLSRRSTWSVVPAFRAWRRSGVFRRRPRRNERRWDWCEANAD